MGQLISSLLRCLGYGYKTITDKKDTDTSLSFNPQGQGHYINISPDDDNDNCEMRSFVLDNASMMRLKNQVDIFVDDEIREVVIMNNHNDNDNDNDDDRGEEDIVDCLNGMKESVVIRKVFALEDRRIGPYRSSQKILLVGEGDFSFSASLGRAFVSAVNILATSLDSQEFLRNNYTRAIRNISSLTERGATVLHGVDCTKLAVIFNGMRCDRIIYNFPHSGFKTRNEPRETQLIQHRTLVRLFLANAKKLIHKELGEIHITHKCNCFHRDWNLRSLAYEQGLVLLEEVPFNRKVYPGYHTMCGFGGNNFFNCYPSKTYKFVFLRNSS